MADNAICTVCGGTEFHNEAGFFYCNECQTQSQDLIEQVYEMHEDTHALKLQSKTVQKDSSTSEQSNKNKLTSWEMYNYILAGLVKELMELGTGEEFKEATYNIWMLYLTKLEILTRNNGTPKLGAMYKKRDAEIVYKKRITPKKRIRSNSTSALSITSSGEIDSKSMAKESAKQKRALAKAEYEQYASTQPTEHSLLNQTLTSLTSDDESSDCPGRIRFSKAARRELLKKMSKEHLEEHEMDVDNKMKCHKVNRHLVSLSYLRSPMLLTRNKLYSIMYIALLLSNSKFQLSDIIRFCREGHLSYLQYRHFFPDTCTEKDIDESAILSGYKSLFSYNYIRKSAFDIYKFVRIKKCNYTPDLFDLCRRYCTELNLPDQIYNIASNLIEKTQPEFIIKENTTLIPNFEGRVMGFIMFTLKLLFSVDDATEKEFTHFVRQLNTLKQTTHKEENILKDSLFVWYDWVNYIEYRKVILKQKHFPTKFMLDPDQIGFGDNFADFLQQKKSAEDLSENQVLQMNVARKRLQDLELLQDEEKDPPVEFQHSVTPLRSYISHLLTMQNMKPHGAPLKSEILQDFSEFKIDYLINPHPYLKLINDDKYEIKLTNARCNQKFVKMSNSYEKGSEELDRSWCEAFKKQKNEVIGFDIIVNKMLEKHVENVSSGKSSDNLLNGSSSSDNFNIQLESNDKLVNNPEVLNSKEEHIKKMRPNLKNLRRDSTGKFSSTLSPNGKDFSEFENKKPKKKGKWIISAANPLLQKHKYNPSLLYQVVNNTNIDKDIAKVIDHEKRERHNSEKSEKVKKKKHTKDDRYKVHYVPRLDYWVNIRDVSQMNNTQWDRYLRTLPAHFVWLLKECSRTVEQTTKELFMEFTCVELYVCYVHLNNVPVMNEQYDNYKHLTKLINKVKHNW